MAAIYYLSHSEVVIDPAVPVPDWGPSTKGRARVVAVRDGGWFPQTHRPRFGWVAMEDVDVRLAAG